MRTFWTTGESELEVLCSSMEAYFDFDAREGEDPEVFGGRRRSSICVSDDAAGDADILRRCFRFRFERSWHDYYERARLTSVQTAALSHHALGTIAIDIPVLLAFFLLLATRSRPAAPASDARAPQSERGQSPEKRRFSNRSRSLPRFCRSTHPVYRRFGHRSAGAQASPCARPSGATGQQAFLAGAPPARQCTGRIHSDPHRHLARRSVDVLVARQRQSRAISRPDVLNAAPQPLRACSARRSALGIEHPAQHLRILAAGHGLVVALSDPHLLEAQGAV